MARVHCHSNIFHDPVLESKRPAFWPGGPTLRYC
jgi:hypothetical protein